MQISPLTPAEEHLMQLLWKLNSFYMKDVLEQHPEPKPHQNTISTYLKILVEKEFLSTAKEGRVFKYSVAIPMEEYRKFLQQNLIENYFENSNEFLKMLIEEKMVNSSDITQFFEVKTTVVPVIEERKQENPIAEFISELTEHKKGKKKKKKEKKKKK